MTGADIIHHEDRLLGRRLAKYFLIDFVSSTFTIHVIAGSPPGTPAWCLTLQVLL